MVLEELKRNNGDIILDEYPGIKCANLPMEQFCSMWPSGRPAKAVEQMGRPRNTINFHLEEENMQKLFRMNFKDEKQAEAFIDKVFANREPGITIEVFGSALEAFTKDEGPYRVNQLIENGELKEPEDRSLLERMGEKASQRMLRNMLEQDDKYSMILDVDVLDEMATDSAVEVFRDSLESLSPYDRKIADEYIEDYG